MPAKQCAVCHRGWSEDEDGWRQFQETLNDRVLTWDVCPRCGSEPIQCLARANARARKKRAPKAQ